MCVDVCVLWGCPPAPCALTLSWLQKSSWTEISRATSQPLSSFNTVCVWDSVSSTATPEADRKTQAAQGETEQWATSRPAQAHVFVLLASHIICFSVCFYAGVTVNCGCNCHIFSFSGPSPHTHTHTHTALPTTQEKPESSVFCVCLNWLWHDWRLKGNLIGTTKNTSSCLTVRACDITSCPYEWTL